MAQFTVTSPNSGFSGDIVGVTFVSGVGTVDTQAGGLAAYSYFQRAGYGLTPVEVPEVEPEGTDPGEFDPGEASVDDVLAHLETADLAEAERIIQAESDGKARKGILTAGGPLLARKEGETR